MTAPSPRRASGVVRILASNSAILFGAGLFSQAISFCSLLILARLYNPEQMGILAVLVSISAVVSTLASGRFDLAIVTEQDDGRAVVYVKLIAVLSLGGALLCLVGGAIAIAAGRVGHGLSTSLWLLPFMVMASGLNMAGAGRAIRARRYGILAANQISLAAFTLLAQLSFAFLLPTDLALPAGFVTGQLCALVVLSPMAQGLRSPKMQQRGLRLMWNAAVAGRTYPLHAAPYSFVAQLYVQLPQILIATFYGLASAGQYTNASRATLAPMALLPNAVGQVLFGEMARAPQDRAWGARVAAITATSGLLMSIFVAAILSAGPEIMTVLLGDKWSQSGLIAQHVVFASLLIALVAGYDRVFDVYALQRLRLILIVCSTAALGCALLLAGTLSVPLMVFVQASVAIQVLSSINWSFWTFHRAGFRLHYLIGAGFATALGTALWLAIFRAVDLPEVIRSLATSYAWLRR